VVGRDKHINIWEAKVIIGMEEEYTNRSLSKSSDINLELELARRGISDLSYRVGELTKAVNKLIEEMGKPPHKSIVETTVMRALQIRDTAVHRSDITDIHIKGNYTETTINSVNIGNSFTVSANSVEARNLSVYSVTWMPFSYCTAQCSTAPTRGALTIKYIKRVG